MGSVSCRDSNFVKRSEDDAWTTPTPSLFIMQPSVTAFSSLPVSYLHRTLQCYRDFMCQAGNTDTANSKPSQKCQIHPPISFMAFLTLIRILSTRLLFCKRDPRSKSEVLDSVCKIKKRLAGGGGCTTL